MAVNGVADYLVGVVLRSLPGQQGGGAGVGRDGQETRRAGQTFPHDHRQLGGGAGRAQTVDRYALVVACVLQRQLVDEQDSGALSLHSDEGPDGLAVLQPVQHRWGLCRAVAHESGGVSPGERHCFRGLENHRRGCREVGDKAF